MKPYYVVIRRGGKAPTVNYQHREKAIAEAERLASQHPGDVFEIARVVAITQTRTAATFWLDGENSAGVDY